MSRKKIELVSEILIIATRFVIFLDQWFTLHSQRPKPMVLKPKRCTRQNSKTVVDLEFVEIVNKK